MSFISRFFGPDIPEPQRPQFAAISQDATVQYSDQINGTRENSVPMNMDPAQDEDLDLELRRPPYLHVSLATEDCL